MKDLAHRHPLVIGAGMLADLDLSSGYVFDGRQACRHAAVAVVLPPALTGRVAIMHGCLPASPFLEITRLEGARVLELDGRPALAVVEERLGVSRDDLLARHPLPALTLGEKHGDPYAPFDDGQYVNRLVIAVDPADDALVLFEADFQVGSRIQLMAYEPQRMIDSAREQTQTLLASLGPAIALVRSLYRLCRPFHGLQRHGRRRNRASARTGGGAVVRCWVSTRAWRSPPFWGARDPWTGPVSSHSSPSPSDLSRHG